MRERCHNPRCPAYRRYGGRGIKVDPQWNDFRAFLEDMGPRPPGYVLHRLDNDGDYTPHNSVWIARWEHASIHNRLRKKVGA
jgi:hypothetical protein